jgi:hypothetical protein
VGSTTRGLDEIRTRKCSLPSSQYDGKDIELHHNMPNGPGPESLQAGPTHDSKAYRRRIWLHCSAIMISIMPNNWQEFHELAWFLRLLA